MIPLVYDMESGVRDSINVYAAEAKVLHVGNQNGIDFIPFDIILQPPNFGWT